MGNTHTRNGRDPALPLLAGVQLSAHDRRQAEQDMRMAERLVDFIFGIVEGTQSLFRRLRRA